MHCKFSKVYSKMAKQKYQNFSLFVHDLTVDTRTVTPNTGNQMNGINRRGRRRTDQIIAFGAVLLGCGERGKRVPPPGVLQRLRDGGTVQHGEGQYDDGGEEERRSCSPERVLRGAARMRGGGRAQGVPRGPRHIGREDSGGGGGGGCGSGRTEPRTHRNQRRKPAAIRRPFLKADSGVWSGTGLKLRKIIMRFILI